jgi:hypothetical protein
MFPMGKCGLLFIRQRIDAVGRYHTHSDARRLLYTLQHPTTFQLVVKHSKFIAHAKSVTTKEDALAYIEEVKDTKATHNCFAYKLSSDERSSDDGEVAGTAGKQILSGECFLVLLGDI